MQQFYFTVLKLIPDNQTDIEVEGYSLHPRKWNVSTFDLATLQTRHKLHISYQLMDVFLQQCNLELVISANSLEEAKNKSQMLRAMLYLEGVSPFVMPFVSSHSVNEYAGINSRDSESLREKMEGPLKEGITSKTTTVEVWPLELTFGFIIAPNPIVSENTFNKAVDNLKKWEVILSKKPELSALQSVLITAPLIIDVGQSLLHIWTGLESLFPTVQQEVTFRVAIYLAQLHNVKEERFDYYLRIKKAYGVRSNVAHGSKKKITGNDWFEAWQLITNVNKEIIRREELPTEEKLLKELFTV